MGQYTVLAPPNGPGNPGYLIGAISRQKTGSDIPPVSMRVCAHKYRISVIEPAAHATPRFSREPLAARTPFPRAG